MGTLGCINDMLQRDKENRELRKIGRERLRGTRDRLLHSKIDLPNISLKELEEIKLKTQEKEKLDDDRLFRSKLLFVCIVIGVCLLIWGLFILI